jgi:hypothetical protein
MFFDNTLEFLCADNSVSGELWRYIRDNKLDEIREDGIPKIGYCIDVGEIIQIAGSKNDVLCFLSDDEKKIFTSCYTLFKGYLLQENDSILYCGYLIPISTQKAKHLYYLKSDLAKPLAKLMQNKDMFSRFPNNITARLPDNVESLDESMGAFYSIRNFFIKIMKGIKNMLMNCPKSKKNIYI